MKLLAVGTLCVSMLLPSMTSSAATQPDPLKITAQEKRACTTDAIRLCSHTYPDELQLLQCMKTNRTSLSTMCLAAFDAGLKRRHMK